MANTDNVKEETQDVAPDTQTNIETLETPVTEPAPVVEETNNVPETQPEAVIEASNNEVVVAGMNNEVTAGEAVVPPQPEVTNEAAPQETELTADEKIIADWLKNGKTEATTNDLIEAGFDPENIDPYSFFIGRYKLSRMLLVSKYKIEKAD